MKNRKLSMAGVALVAAGGALLVSGVAQAKPPRSAETVATEHAALMAAVARGDAVWHNGKLGNNTTGLGCANCHPDGSAANPETFPKFQTNLGKVGTLREMINWCILVPLQGQMLPLDSDDMIAMEAYATYRSNGLKINIGGDYQSGAVPVTDGGAGYPGR